MGDLKLRSATASDAEAIADIYNHYVRTSTATFDTQEKTAEDRRAWLADHGPTHPVIVAERDGRVIAWGSLSPWGTRCAWRNTVEVSVYVAHDAVGGGIGPMMLAELVALARNLGHHALISQITSENAPSLKMGARAGFREVGVLKEVGRKFDRWLDLVLLELVIDGDDGGAQ